jgi:hypothetical protein
MNYNQLEYPFKGMFHMPPTHHSLSSSIRRWSQHKRYGNDLDGNVDILWADYDDGACFQ